MGGRDGGTRMYCPECDEDTVCGARSPASLGEIATQSVRSVNDPGLNWFQRGRECLTCGHTFITAEISEDFVFELIKLRDALKDIKMNASVYIKESESASGTLKNLAKSLSVLKALE